MPSHKNQYYERLLDILTRAQADIEAILGQMDAKNLKSVSDILAIQDETQRVGHALWNLTCIFYRIGNVYGPGDRLDSWRKGMDFAKVLAVSIQPLRANIILLDKDIKFSDQNKLFTYINQLSDQYKQEMHINNAELFKLGVIFVGVLHEINPDNYDSSSTEENPNTADLYKKIPEFWRRTLKQLPHTITTNLCAYFSQQTLEQQLKLAAYIPNNRFTEELYKKISTLLDSSIERAQQTAGCPNLNGQKSLKPKLKKPIEEKEDDDDSGHIINDDNLIWEMGHAGSSQSMPHLTPLQNWQRLQNKYFAEKQPTGQFHACLHHYAYSFYTAFETFIAYLWFISGYNYGETRQERRENLATKLKKLMENIATDIQALSDTHDNKYEAEKKLLTNLKEIRHTIKNNVNLFGSIFGDSMTDCLVNLDGDIYLFCQENILPSISQRIKTLQHSGSPLHQSEEEQQRERVGCKNRVVLP